MTTVAASDLKNKFGQIMDQARREPVLVQSHGRDVVVIVDHEEFARLKRVEDAYWAARADKATKSGFLSPKETAARLKKRFDKSEE